VKIDIVTPGAPGTTLGNAITADRWARILRRLGHQVMITMQWVPGIKTECDLLVALHARRSRRSIERFRRIHPARPLIVTLTGTDLYGDLPAHPEAQRSLALATRIIALQQAARDQLQDEFRAKLSVIYQSAVPPSNPRQPSRDQFEVCVLSHLRDVKDPLRAAWAARTLPSESRVLVLHAGRALSGDWATRAREEERVNPRYRWLGDQPHDRAMHLLSGARLLVLPSLMEGGASAIAEAVVCGIPVLCSNIPGNIGMLGRDYPGYFRVQHTENLAQLLRRAETDQSFLKTLRQRVTALQSRFSPQEEISSWTRLLAVLSSDQ
jgi:putative glycosyltransferase (TIGR04348 family)